MFFKWWDAQALKVETNWGRQNWDEEGNKVMKCFEETVCFFSGTYTNRKYISFNITFSSKNKKIKIHLTSKKKNFCFIRFLSQIYHNDEWAQFNMKIWTSHNNIISFTLTSRNNLWPFVLSYIYWPDIRLIVPRTCISIYVEI